MRVTRISQTSWTPQLSQAPLGAVLLAAAALAPAFSGTARAQSVLAEYDFQTGSPTVPGKTFLQSNDVDPNSTAANLTVGTGLNRGVGAVGDLGPDVGNPSDTSAPFAVGADDSFSSTSLEAAITRDSYLSFFLSPDASATLNLASLSFTAAIRNDLARPNPINRVSVLSSVTGFTAADSLLDATVTASFAAGNGIPYQSFFVNLGSAPFQSLTGSTEFRLYFFNPNRDDSLSDTSLHADNIIVQGTAVPSASTAAPEPGSLALLLPVMGTVGMVIRRRRKA